MVSIFKIIADKKQEFKEYSRKRRTEQLKNLQQQAKVAVEDAKLKKEIDEQEAIIKEATGGTIMDKIKDKLKNNEELIRLRQMEAGANPTSPFPSDNRQSLMGSVRNIHEGVGRNIWEDSPNAPSIWEKKPKKTIWN